MPMHCSANSGGDNEVAIFFGLSGTGKTTLSADPTRTLIGDDEHGWGEMGVFNFEGGCYAKAIKLSREAEPEIYATTERFGTVMENVTLDPVTHAPDFDDASKTENTRVAYPLDFIANASATGRDGPPKTIVMLTCDAFGVLPPIAKLDPAQAMYHFLSGYTAKVAGTERGVTEPSATFSTCFGAPFMPRHPSVYGNLLRDLIERHDVDCWLVNTGWTGGKFGVGRRMPIQVTRNLLSAALDGSLNRAEFRTDPYFGLSVPTSARRRRSDHPRTAQDLGERGRVRRDGFAPRRHVPRQLRQIRAPRRRDRARGGAGGERGGGVSAATLSSSSACGKGPRDWPQSPPMCGPAEPREGALASTAAPTEPSTAPRIDCAQALTPRSRWCAASAANRSCSVFRNCFPCRGS